MMRRIIFISKLCLFSLFTSCNSKEFYRIEGSDISYQIYPTKEGILRAVNTDGEGVRKLQLFSSTGDLVEEVSMHNEPFLINKWEKNSIEIKFLVNDLKLFKPWYEKNMYKPNKLGKYAISYNYQIVLGGNIRNRIVIDSFLC